jgi:hypothetical protein
MCMPLVSPTICDSHFHNFSHSENGLANSNIWTPPGCQQGNHDRRIDQDRMQSYIRPVVKRASPLAIMGIRAPRANR